MCNSVILNGSEYWTPRELAALLGGGDKLVWQEESPFINMPEGQDWRDLDLCLCPIDLKATLGRAGLRWHVGDDPMQHFIE